ncbi:MAG: SEC-C domain-containing protein [Desulfovibrionales bacterium]|nr:MAG: SEC-C domain-containing protein [Desulfovibrionales bacterium]
MGKLGRNAACHCGSGKKYKKCCLRMDEEKAKPATPLKKAASEEDALFMAEVSGKGTVEDDFETLDEGDAEADIPEGDDGDSGQDGWIAAKWSELDVHSLRDIRKSLPELSEEDDSVLDVFLSAFHKINDVDALRAHLDGFIASRPDLLVYGNEFFESLHALGTMYNEADRLEDYESLILLLRRDFKELYLQNFNMLDRDMVTLLAITGRYDEINGFLENFRKYPSEEPGDLFSILDLLFALNLWRPALDLAQGVYLEMTLNPGLMNCEDIQVPVTMNCYASALDAVRGGARPETAAEGVVECFRGLRLPILPKWRKPEPHLARIQHILSTDRPWNLEGCTTRLEVLRRYGVMLDHFMRFLHDKAHLHWLTANQYCLWIDDFFQALIPKGRIPRRDFPLTRENTKKAVMKSTTSVSSRKVPKCFGMLNALHLLADFLVQTGSVPPEYGSEVQEWVGDISSEFFQQLKNTDLTARAFSRFPLFRADQT